MRCSRLGVAGPEPWLARSWGWQGPVRPGTGGVSQRGQHSDPVRSMPWAARRAPPGIRILAAATNFSFRELCGLKSTMA